jgi:DHA2 family multidrug resistance protein
LQAHGYSHASALRGAYALYYDQLQAQTKFLGFMDCFFLIGLITLCAAPLVLLTKNFKSGKVSAGH